MKRIPAPRIRAFIDKKAVDPSYTTIRKIQNYRMEAVRALLDTVSIVAQVLGFLALYAIAMAVTDWRRFEKLKQKDNETDTV